MNTKLPYQELNGLPASGPMYKSITHVDEPFYSEGYVVQFTRMDGSEWVANFQPGWTKFNETYFFPEQNRIVVIAGGAGYVMSPEKEDPIAKFGLTITEAIQSEDGSLIFADGICATVFENSNGQLWQSERISWDGMRDLEIENEYLIGEAYDPTNSKKPWSKFKLNLETRNIEYSCYKSFMNRNDMHVSESGTLENKSEKKPWWKKWSR